ncbi:H-NS histone family protein [Methylophaga sp.]|uniref:H-NS histone family protein n=1 Tax=Methylophaga sp. TaxID=2024840 RepID=UPI003F70931C
MIVDLSKMNLQELKDLKNRVDAAIASFEERKLKEAKEAVNARLKELGFKLEDLVDKPSKRKRMPIAPKYAHPENPELTWSGRGRKPARIVDHLERGRSLDDLLIKT